jgi:uncharacterized protein (DUF934 family)
MALIRDGAIATDEWVRAAEGKALPAGAPTIVPFARWLVDSGTLRGHSAPLGLYMTGADDPEAIAADVGRFALIAIEFPAFTDGRGYSTARILRERLGFQGELRAVGDVLRDQFLFLHRCGFDAFEVAETDAAAWHAALAEFRVWYQPTGDGRAPALALRHRAQAAE